MVIACIFTRFIDLEFFSLKSDGERFSQSIKRSRDRQRSRGSRNYCDPGLQFYVTSSESQWQLPLIGSRRVDAVRANRGPMAVK